MSDKVYFNYSNKQKRDYAHAFIIIILLYVMPNILKLLISERYYW